MRKVLPEASDVESVKTADIEVRIVIDREGAVVCAGGTAAEPDLFEQSVAAARQWKFKPYELKGKAVVVESSIIFHFSNGKVGAR